MPALAARMVPAMGRGEASDDRPVGLTTDLVIRESTARPR
jgi:LacI family transcriptional regulator